MHNLPKKVAMMDPPFFLMKRKKSIPPPPSDHKRGSVSYDHNYNQISFANLKAAV